VICGELAFDEVAAGASERWRHSSSGVAAARAGGYQPLVDSIDLERTVHAIAASDDEPRSDPRRG
jgi:hypothetical protein